MNEELNNQNNSEYKKVLLDKQHSRAWSVASLTVSIVSLICCCFVSWLGIVLSALAIVFAIISRRNIGYFDGLSLAGLIVGIFGIVFGVASIILAFVLEQSGFYDEILKELEEMEKELENGTVTPDL